MSRNSAAARSANMMASLGESTGAPADVISIASGRNAGFDRNPEAGYIAIDLLDPDPTQPRTSFDPEYIASLAESIREKGMLQPIVVMRSESSPGRWIIVAGHCRYLAAKQAGLSRIPCVRREFVDPAEILTIQLVENCNREDLNEVDKGEAYKRLMVAKSWSQAELARQLHVSKSQVSKALTILEADEYTKTQIVTGELAAKHAYRRQVAEKREEQEGRPRQSRMTERTFSVAVDDYDVVFIGKIRKANVPDSVFVRAIAELAKKQSKD